jgi:hypothetical protein
MYGIINRAIEDLVKENFGEEKWLVIKERSGIDVDFFISHEPYDDAITYQLAGAISAEMDMHIDAVLGLLGEWWVLRTGMEKYGGLMKAGGSNLKEFLINLPSFHSRVMLMYPKLSPPEFQVSHVEENGLYLHYHSQRIGLKAFVGGLLSGLGKLYSSPISFHLIQSRDEGATHEIFKVNW